ncbi:MAG: energy transducer TonB [bacterium]|nr:energy transducer TonB [bacterium]
MAFDADHYKTADSLFTLAIDSGGIGYTYYMRALVRSKLGNRKGYCNDLANAAERYNEDSKYLFKSNCGTIDTIYHDGHETLTSKDKARSVILRYHDAKYNYDIDFKYARNFRPFVSGVLFSDTNEIAVTADTMPVFRGGNAEASRFVAKNLIVPYSFYAKASSGKIYSRFIVSKLGAVEDIEILKGIPDCTECSIEVIKMIEKMPNWKPAVLNGKPVNMTVIFPIAIKK